MQQQAGKKGGIPPVVIVGAGLGVVALLMSRGGGGGGSGAGMQLDAYGQQLNEARDEARRAQQQAEKDAREAQDQAAQDAAKQNAFWAQQLTALNASIQHQIDSQNKALERGLQQSAQAQQQQQQQYNAAWQQWQAQIAKLLEQMNRQGQGPVGTPTKPPVSFVGGPNVNYNGPGPGNITRDQATEWWRKFGGGVSPWNANAGPLSGPQGERIHSSDVWKFIRQNGRYPASPQEFLTWWTQGGGKGH